MKKRTVNKIKKYKNAPILMNIAGNDIYVTYYFAEYNELLDNNGSIIESLPVSFKPVPFTKEEIMEKLRASIVTIDVNAAEEKISIQKTIDEITILG